MTALTVTTHTYQEPPWDNHAAYQYRHEPPRGEEGNCWILTATLKFNSPEDIYWMKTESC